MARQSKRVGTRWVDEPPSAEDFASWIKDNVRVHDGLDVERYISGITLIEQAEEVEQTGVDIDGNPATGKVKRPVFIPFPTASARLLYFHDYAKLNEWLPRIRAVDVKTAEGVYLPPGFFETLVKQPGGKVVESVGYAVQAGLVVAGIGSTNYHDVEKLPFVAATKVVPLVNRWGDVDPEAMTKAQTGAISRALGYNGMLLVPGAGVSSAEDITPTHVDVSEAEEAPEPAVPNMQRADELLAQLKEKSAEKYELFMVWANEKRISVQSLTSTEARAVVRQLERRLAEA